MPVFKLSPEDIAGLRTLDLRARTIVEGFLIGLHKSPWSGFSIEYTGYRPYYPGDSLRHIDWKLWGRTDRYYIKLFEEETNTRVFILIDISKSLDYGEGAGNKWRYVQTLAAALSFLALLNRDAPSVVFLQDEDMFILPPSAKFGQWQRILKLLEENKPRERNPNWEGIFRKLRPRLKRRSLIFILSDFMFQVEHFKPALAQMRFLKGDLSLFQILHRDEIAFPFDDDLRLEDLESEDYLEISASKWQKGYLDELKKHQEGLKKTGR